MKILGKIRVGAAALGAVMCFSSAQALYVIDYIDFNEQWLRQDAYNRTMNQAKKNLNPPDDSAYVKDVKTDILYTGALVRAGDHFFDMDGIEQIAQLFPAAQQDEGRRLLVEGIDKLNGSVEQLYGIPKENVATGIVALLGGAYAAYFNHPMPDEAVKPAFLQIAEFLRKKPELFEGKATEMMNSYQISMGLGFLLMAMQQELQQHPNTAHEAELKAVGRLVFKSLLNVEPEQMDFTKSGIVFK